MKTWKIFKSYSRDIKPHSFCTYSAFIEKNAMAALQDSYTDLSKLNFSKKILCCLCSTLWLFFLFIFAILKTIESNFQHHQVSLLLFISFKKN